MAALWAKFDFVLEFLAYFRHIEVLFWLEISVKDSVSDVDSALAGKFGRR